MAHSGPVDASGRLYQIVGERVRRHRESLHMSQEVLGDRIGRARTTVSNFEAGRQKLPLHQLLLIAMALDVELRDLIPAREELDHPGTIPVQVGRTSVNVPPEAAKLIEGILLESKNDQRPRSSR